MRIVLAIGLAILTASSVFADDERIWLENTKIDGKAVKMAFDSGAGSIVLTSEAVKRLGLKIVTPPTNGAGDTAVYSAEFNGVRFRTDFTIIDFDARLIPDIDGLIGWSALSSDIFRIDADARKLSFLYQVPAGIKGWTQLPIDTNSDTLDLEVPGNKRGWNTITVDTGSGFGIELTTREWKQWKKTHPHNPMTMEGYWTLDGIYAGEESWADKIQIGPLIFYDVPIMEAGPSTAIQLGSERDTLGLAALRRLDVVVDGIHGVAYLRTKQTTPPQYSYNRLGAVFIPTTTNSNDLIAQVITGTPAYDAGVRGGDILLKVNGKSVSGWPTDNKRTGSDAYSMPAGTKVQLTLQRNKTVFETTATLCDILQTSHRKYEANDNAPGIDEMDAEISFNQGLECERQSDSNGALTNYDKAIETDPDFGDAYGRRAYLEQSNSNLDAALADYDKAINLGAGKAEDYGNCGRIEQAKGDTVAALADYSKAVEMEPDWADIYAYRGSLEYRENRLDAALADFNKAIKLEPDLAEAYAQRGWLEQHQKNQFDATIVDYEKALQLKPDQSWIKPNLAQIYGYRGSLEQTTGKLDAALADDDKSIRLDPGSGRLYGNRGALEGIKGDLDRAEADCAKAARLDPKLSTNAAQEFQALGKFRYQRFEYANALTDYRKACELEPTDDYAHFDVWLCSSSLGHTERATEDLKAYLGTRDPKNFGDWASEVGRFLVGQITEQVFLIAAKSADVKKDKEQHCEAYYYIGAKRLIAGDKTGAVVEFRKCVATDVQNWVEYDFAKADLQMLKASN